MTSRENRQESIYAGDQDRRVFLEVLAEVVTRDFYTYGLYSKIIAQGNKAKGFIE